jgi:hypothetical protein
MVRVGPSLVLAGAQVHDALLQVVERDREVPRIAARWLQPEPSGAENAHPHERQYLEADERRQLRQLVDGDVARREHDNP